MKKKLLLCLICFACVLASFSTGFSAFAAEEPGGENISFELTSEPVIPSTTFVSSSLTFSMLTPQPTPVSGGYIFNFNTTYTCSTYDTLGYGYTINVNGIPSSHSSSYPSIIPYSSSFSITRGSRITGGTEASFFQLSSPSLSDAYLTVSFNGSLFSTAYFSGNTITGTLTANSGYGLPDTITVSMNGEVVPATGYTYNANNGAFEIANITGDIEITAEAVEYPTVTINSNEEYTTTLPEHIIVGGNLSGTIFPDDEGLVIRKIEVDMVGNTGELVNYTFDRESGAFYLPGVTGDVTIDLTIGEPPTQAEILGDTIGGFLSQLWSWLADGANAIIASPILLVILVAIPVGSFLIYFVVRLIKRGSR